MPTQFHQCPNTVSNGLWDQERVEKWLIVPLGTWQEGRICWVEKKGMKTLLCASEESFSGTPMRAYRRQGHFEKSGARAEGIGVSRWGSASMSSATTELPPLRPLHILPYLLAPLSANCLSSWGPLPLFWILTGSSASPPPSTKDCQEKRIRCEWLNLQCSLCGLRCCDLFPGVFACKFLAFCGMKHFDAGIPLYLLIHSLCLITLGPWIADAFCLVSAVSFSLLFSGK